MRRFFLIIGTVLLLSSCRNQPEISSVNPVNWAKREAVIASADSLVRGSTYLSVYSQIYQRTEQHLYDLTATISMRNISSVDSVYIFRADYYNTQGDLIRSYFDQPVYIAPLETIEIVIDETDTHGGTGANFIFDWGTPPAIHEPLFEAVMISTTGQQGLSFVTQGVKR